MLHGLISYNGICVIGNARLCISARVTRQARNVLFDGLGWSPLRFPARAKPRHYCPLPFRIGLLSQLDKRVREKRVWFG